jgi:hypothetical protein
MLKKSSTRARRKAKTAGSGPRLTVHMNRSVAMKPESFWMSQRSQRGASNRSAEPAVPVGEMKQDRPASGSG